MGIDRERSSDEELLQACRREPAAFGAFYARHEERLLRYFVGRVGDAEVAADLTAETFAAALTGAHRFRARKGPAAAWLFGIARNVWPRASGAGGSRHALARASGRPRWC